MREDDGVTRQRRTPGKVETTVAKRLTSLDGISGFFVLVASRMLYDPGWRCTCRSVILPSADFP